MVPWIPAFAGMTGKGKGKGKGKGILHIVVSIFWNNCSLFVTVLRSHPKIRSLEVGSMRRLNPYTHHS